MKIFLFLSTLIISTNALAQLNPGPRTEELATFRGDLENKMDKTPYYGEEHTTIKRYFTELQELNEDLQNSSRYLRRFNNYIRDVGAETFCNEALLEQEKWTQLIKNCTKNNFFLCSEEVKLYPNIKEVLLNLLYEDVRKQMLAAKSCK